MSIVDDMPINSFQTFKKKLMKTRKNASMILLADLLKNFSSEKNANVYGNKDDFVTNYGLCFIFLAILLLQMKDTQPRQMGKGI